MPLLTLTALTVSLLGMAFFGAGVFRGAAPAAAAVLAAVAAVVAWRRRSRKTGGTAKWSPILVAGVAVLAVLLCTLLPLPMHLGLLMGPTRLASQLDVADALEAAAELDVLPARYPFFSLTRNKAGTMRITVIAAAALAAAVLAASLPAQWRHACAWILVAMAAAVAAAGVASRLWWPQGSTVWWLFPVGDSLPGPLGCFVNRNHFGGFVAMMSPLALVLVTDNLTARRFLSGACGAAALVITTAAVFLSLSRGAIIAYAAGMLFTAFLVLRQKGPAPALAGVFLLAALGMGAWFLPHPAVRQRIESLRHVLQDSSLRTRMEAWADTTRIWRTYPVFGAGANAYRMVYPQHRRTSARAFREHAENEYLQLAAEGGVIGVGLLVLLLIAVTLEMRNARAAPHVAPYRTAALGALAVAGVHALVDFPLRTPLYAIALAVVVALSFAPDGQRRRALAPCLLPLLVVVLLCPFWRTMRRRDSTRHIAEAPLNELARALCWAPTSWRTWYYFGGRVARAGTQEATILGERCMSNAAAYDPNNYVLWQALCEVRLQRGDHKGAQEAFDRAQRLRFWLTPPKGLSSGN